MIVIKRYKKSSLTIEKTRELKALGYEIECNNGKVTKVHKKEA